MTQFGFRFSALALLALLATAPVTRAAATNDPLDFKEVYDLVRSHVAGMTEADLNRAAVEGLFSSLRGKVSLVASDEQAAMAAEVALIARSTVLEEDVAYLRVNRVADGLAQSLRTAFEKLNATAKLKGVVLDLRFAGGDDYAAAAAAADLFVAKERPLLDWGDGMVKSKEKKDALNLPVAVLVNRATTGAPEALAATLRDAGVGLILGGTTAGAAMTSREFALKSGQRLRIASSPVKSGDGSALSAQGVKPDIEVAVNLEDERGYLDDAYGFSARTNLAAVAGSVGPTDGTNRPARRPRPSEADLVRARRDGADLEDFTPARDREPEKPLIRDPALARAVDLLKGLAVVRRTRS